MRTRVPSKVLTSVSRFLFGTNEPGQTTRFLLLPKTINGETRWLERATWKWVIVTYFDGLGEMDIREAVEWVDA